MQKGKIYYLNFFPVFNYFLALFNCSNSLEVWFTSAFSLCGFSVRAFFYFSHFDKFRKAFSKQFKVGLIRAAVWKNKGRNKAGKETECNMVRLSGSGKDEKEE